MMRRPLLAATICFLLSDMAGGQDRAAWFKSLKQPGTGYGCCDVADCRRHDARWHAGGWQVLLEAGWTPVPPEIVLEAPKSIDGDAYACIYGGALRCFVPPWTVF